jgi:hypothetical protein
MAYIRLDRMKNGIIVVLFSNMSFLNPLLNLLLKQFFVSLLKQLFINLLNPLLNLLLNQFFVSLLKQLFINLLNPLLKQFMYLLKKNCMIKLKKVFINYSETYIKKFV